MTDHTPERCCQDGYTVTADGRVFSTSHNWRGFGRHEMRQHPNRDGYPKARLTVSGKRRCFIVHKLVAETFLPPKPNDADQIRHLDGDPTNNRASNLCWGPALDNAEDREKHGNPSRGAEHGVAIASSERFQRYNRERRDG